MQVNNNVMSTTLQEYLLKWGFSVTLILVVLATLAGCYPQAGKREMPPPMVRVAEAKQQNVRFYIDYTGKTAARESVSVPARVQGILEKMTFTPGQIVKKGDPLFVIEQTQYKADVQQAKANLDTVRADMEYAQADYERTVELYDGNKAMTLDDVQERTKNLEKAKAAVESAEAVLIEAELRLSYTEISAPISGKISRNLVDVGNLVDELSSAVTPLATINNMDPIYVYFEISDSDFYTLTEMYGQPTVKPYDTKEEAEQDVEVQSQDDEPNAASQEEIPPWPFALQLMRQEEDGMQATSLDEQYPFKGIINYIDNTIKPSVGGITLRGEIPNPDFTIFPGAVCHIKVPAATLSNATVVYDKAVASDLGHHYMFVVNKDNKVERRVVEKGPAVDREFSVVFSGINPGESYIVEGLQKVRVDQPVDAKPYEPEKVKPEQKKETPKTQKPALTLERPEKEVFKPLPKTTEEDA